MNRAKEILQQHHNLFGNNKESTTHTYPELLAKLYIGQLYYNERKVDEARRVALDILQYEEAREHADLMKGVLDILSYERPTDPPFRFGVDQMGVVLEQIRLVMEKHHLVTDFMRLITGWALHLWEQANIDNRKHIKRFGDGADDGNHFSILLHPFILALGKLEQIKSDLFESQFTLLRKEITLARDAIDLFHPVPTGTIASTIAHQTMFNQGILVPLLAYTILIFH